MRKINEILAVVLLSLAAVLAAAIGLRAYDAYVIHRQVEQEKQAQEEILARNRQANDRVIEMRQEIQELSADREKLAQFLEEIQTAQAETAVLPVSVTFDGQDSGMSGDIAESDMTFMSENMAEMSADTAYVSENEAFAGKNIANEGENTTDMSSNMMIVSDNMIYVSENSGIPENKSDAMVMGDDSVSENETGVTVSGNGSVSENESDVTVSGNGSVSENETGVTVSGNSSVSENETGITVSGNDSVSANETGVTVSGNDSVSANETGVTVSGNGSVSENETGVTVSGNDSISGNGSVAGLPWVSPRIRLEERRKNRSSYEETLLANEADIACLAARRTDFSGKKIACLGDSITAAANLEGQENYPACSYPAVLRELLGAGEVCNLGIGGSSIGRYWSDAFVERYLEIPQDTDIIIVMGGTNDGFCLSEQEFGTLAERKPWTFCGDLDELMRGLREHYPQAEIYFVTPLPNILQDYLMQERSYLVPQKKLADVILTLSALYDFRVIDLYNSNILDSHDADIVAEYMPDGVHANEEGYRILARHIAAEILRYEEGITEPLQ